MRSRNQVATNTIGIINDSHALLLKSSRWMSGVSDFIRQPGYLHPRAGAVAGSQKLKEGLMSVEPVEQFVE